MKRLLEKIQAAVSVGKQMYWDLLVRSRGSGKFPGSAEYWEKRYATGGDSGVGSYSIFSEFKAGILNEFVVNHNIRSIIEFGCGDGSQLSLASYNEYIGFDISETVILRCQERFRQDDRKRFRHMDQYNGEIAELTLSLDVIYHLIEDAVFARYMHQLFGASRRYVIIYASDTDDNRGYEGTHVKHRNFTKWIGVNIPGWRLMSHIPNKYPYRGDYRTGSFADFFVYEVSAGELNS